MRTSSRKLSSSLGIFSSSKVRLSSSAATLAASTSPLSSRSTQVSFMDKLLWGMDIKEHVANFSSTELENLITSAGKGKSQPLPLEVHALAISKLLAEGEAAKATDIALGRLVAQDRGTLVEMAASLCSDWTVAWSWVRSLQTIEKGPILRALLIVAQKSEKQEIIDEALTAVLITCRRRKQLAGEVLSLYCQIAPTARWTEGNELLDMAQQSGEYFDIQSVGPLLWLMIRANQQKRVLGLWNWLKETTAGNNKSVVSAVIVALSKERLRLADALQLMQHLARSDEDPSPEAQIATIELMTGSRRPNPSYALELVNYWVPVNAYTSMRLNLAVATAFAKMDGEKNTERAGDVMLRVANDPEQAMAVKPAEIVQIGPSLARSESGVTVLEKLSATMSTACASQGIISGMGVVLAFAALTYSEDIFQRFMAKFCEIVSAPGFDFAHASIAPSTTAETKYLSLYESDEEEASSTGLTPPDPSGATRAASEETDTQLAFEFVLREMFASLTATHFSKGKTMAARVAAALTNADIAVSVPEDTSEWFGLINGSENDDASVILDEIGKD